MPVPQTLPLAAPGGAPDPVEPPSKQPAHLVLVSAPGASHADAILARRQAFGPRLKAARERCGVGVEDIARATKVSPSLLTALERGDVSKWPKGIFRRAFFRDYIAAIGLPAEPHVREFLELFPDGEDHPVARSVAAPPADATTPLRLTLAPPSRWSALRRHVRSGVGDLPAVLLLAGAVTWWMDASAWAGAGTIGLCYFPRVATAITRGISPGRRRRKGATNP